MTHAIGQIELLTIKTNNRLLKTKHHVTNNQVIATLEELSTAFVAAGFTLLPWRGIGYEGSLSIRFEGFDIWDVHPANVLLSPEGLALPIDVIITQTPS